MVEVNKTFSSTKAAVNEREPYERQLVSIGELLLVKAPFIPNALGVIRRKMVMLSTTFISILKMKRLPKTCLA